VKHLLVRCVVTASGHMEDACAWFLFTWVKSHNRTRGPVTKIPVGKQRANPAQGI
jgi:hypothetical protein